MRLGADNFYHYFRQFGLLSKTNIDLPGEAATIMHSLDNIGQVELATMSFGQSFQITPLQLLRAASAVVNGGTLVTPHFGMYATNEKGEPTKTFSYTKKEQAIQKTTSDTMKELLEAVVAEGSGNKGSVEGYRIGGKTATSEKLPRGNAKYISSFLGFAPTDNPQIIGIIMIDEPVGIYYGGTIAAPVMSEMFSNILPYLGLEADYTESEEKTETTLSEDRVE